MAMNLIKTDRAVPSVRIQFLQPVHPPTLRGIQVDSSNKWALYRFFFYLRNQKVGLAALFSPRIVPNGHFMGTYRRNQVP